tara:strand:+ start:167 stop:2875 length:2709 start_codon:yes stop_codon:yes gene_type:complete
MPISIQPIHCDDTLLHGDLYDESVCAAKVDGFIDYYRDRTTDDDKSRLRLLRLWKVGATLDADGRYVRRTTLQPDTKTSGGSNTTIKKYGHIGRAYFKDGVSLSLMPRDLRGALSEDYYVDLDLVRCHPAGLLQYCKANGVTPPALDEYVSNFADLENEWAAFTGASSDQTKRLVNILLNGGSFGVWLYSFGLPETTPEPPFVARLLRDVEMIYAEIKKDPHVVRIYQSRRKQWLRKPSDFVNGEPTQRKVALNKLMENVERCAIEHVFSQFTPVELRQLRYEWDGFAMPRSMFETKNLGWLHSFCDGAAPMYDLAFKEKPFDTSLLPIVAAAVQAKNESFKASDDEDINSDLQFDRDSYKEKDAKKLDTYAERKVHFEHFHAHIMDRCVIRNVMMECNVDGKLERKVTDYPQQNFGMRMPGLMEDAGAELKGKGKSFVKKWLCDANRAAYDCSRWLPFDGVYSADQHKRVPGSTFNEFAGYHPAIIDGQPTARDRKNFANWRKIAKEACGGTKPFRIFMQLVGHKIKNPQRRLEYAIVWRSMQGEGKDTTITAIELLMGSDQVLKLQQMDSFKQLGGTGRLKNKLLIQVNECDKSQMKGLEGSLKSWAVDPYVEVRELYSNPQKAKMFGLWIICSNKLYVISVDTDSGERRYFVFEGSGKYAACNNATKLPTQVWADLHDINGGMASPGFIKLLYNYVTDEYQPDYDFRAAKAENAQCDAYQRMMGAQRRDEISWLQDFIESCDISDLISDTNMALKGGDIDLRNDPVIADACRTPEFQDHPSWAATVRVSLESLYLHFKAWANRNSMNISATRTLKEFKNNLFEVLKLPVKRVELKVGANALMEFCPRTVYHYMTLHYMTYAKDHLMEEMRAMTKAEDDARNAIVEPVASDSECDASDSE